MQLKSDLLLFSWITHAYKCIFFHFECTDNKWSFKKYAKKFFYWMWKKINFLLWFTRIKIYIFFQYELLFISSEISPFFGYWCSWLNFEYFFPQRIFFVSQFSTHFSLLSNVKWTNFVTNCERIQLTINKICKSIFHMLCDSFFIFQT